jgi:hypothetical protein
MGQNLSGERMDDHQVMMDMGQRDSTDTQSVGQFSNLEELVPKIPGSPYSLFGEVPLG